MSKGINGRIKIRLKYRENLLGLVNVVGSNLFQQIIRIKDMSFWIKEEVIAGDSTKNSRTI